jgi:hypothetical protein
VKSSALDPDITAIELGFCERSPEIQFEAEYEGTLNATGGTRYGAIYTYQGAEADIDALLTRFDLSAVKMLASRFGFVYVEQGKEQPILAVGVPNEPGVIGKVISEPPGNANVCVIISYPFVKKSISFPICLVRAVKVLDIGTIPRKMFIRFRAVRNFYGAVGGGPVL